MRNFIDSLFGPPIQFLDMCIAKMNSVGTIAARGVRLDDYFGFIAVLGPSWTGLITSFLVCFLFLFILHNVQGISSVLLWFKSLIGRWL